MSLTDNSIFSECRTVALTPGIGVLMLANRHSVTQLLIAWLILPIAGPLLAADWPQWRGPNRDGTWTETGILSSFPSTGLILKWKMPAGFGYSTPIISNGKVYMSDLVVENSNVYERVLCLKASSGKQ